MSAGAEPPADEDLNQSNRMNTEQLIEDPIVRFRFLGRSAFPCRDRRNNERLQKALDMLRQRDEQAALQYANYTALQDSLSIKPITLEKETWNADLYSPNIVNQKCILCGK